MIQETKTPQVLAQDDEEIRTFDDSHRKVQTDEIIRRANKNVLRYLQYKNWGNKKANKFMEAYSQIMNDIADGNIDYRNAGMQWHDKTGKLSNSQDGFDAVGEVLSFLDPIVNDETTYTPKPKEVFTADQFNKYFINEKYGGVKPNQLQWDAWRNLDSDDKNGKRGKVNRAHALANMIPKFIEYIKNKKFDFKNSSFGTEENYINKLKEAQKVLSDGTYDSADTRLCSEIGINLGDFLSDDVTGEEADLKKEEEKKLKAESPEGKAEVWNKEFEEYMEKTYGDVNFLKQAIAIKPYDEKMHGGWKNVTDSVSEINNLGKYLSIRNKGAKGNENDLVHKNWGTYVGLLYKEVDNANTGQGSALVKNSDGTYYVPNSFNANDHTGWVFDPNSSQLLKKSVSEISSLRLHLASQYAQKVPINGKGSIWYTKKGGVLKYEDGGSTSSSSSTDSSSDDSSNKSEESYTEMELTPQLIEYLKALQNQGQPSSLITRQLSLDLIGQYAQQSNGQLQQLQQVLLQPLTRSSELYLLQLAGGNDSSNITKYQMLAQMQDPFAYNRISHNYSAEILAISLAATLQEQQGSSLTGDTSSTQNNGKDPGTGLSKETLDKLNQLQITPDLQLQQLVNEQGRTKELQIEDSRMPIYRDKQGNWHTNFKAQDYERMASLALDIGSLIASYKPGYGTVASFALGAGSSITNFVADLTSGEGLGTSLKNLGGNLAADVMGVVPVLGTGASMSKMAKTVAKTIGFVFKLGKQYMYMTTALQGFGAAKLVYDKLQAGKDLTTQDWKTLYSFTKNLITLGKTRATQKKVNTMVDKASIKASGDVVPALKTAKGNVVKIPKGEARAFNDLKTVTEKEVWLRQKGILSEEDNLLTKTVNVSGNIRKHIPFVPAKTTKVLDTGRYDLSKMGNYKWDPQTGKHAWYSDAGLIERGQGMIHNPGLDASVATQTTRPQLALPGIVTNPDGSQTIVKRKGGTVDFVKSLKSNFTEGTSKFADGGSIRKYGKASGKGGVTYKKSKKTNTGRINSPSKVLGIGLVEGADNWGNTVGNLTWDKILNILQNDRDYYKTINQAQTEHARLRDAANGKWGAEQAYIPNDNSVADYQTKYLNGKYGSWNDVAIGPNFSRYDLSLGKRYSKDRPKDWNSDNWYANITDDRRLLGRDDEYSDAILLYKNLQLQPYGLLLYKDVDNYYKLKELLPQVPIVPNMPTPTFTGTFARGKTKRKLWDKIKGKLKGVNFKDAMMEMIPNINLARLIKVTNKNYRRLVNSLRPNLKNPYWLLGRVLGDLATMNYYNNQAAGIENYGKKARTSDASLNTLAAMDAYDQAQGYREKGWLADNANIEKTAAEAKTYQDENTKLYNAVANANNAELNNLIATKAKLANSKDLAINQSITTRMKEIYGNWKNKKALEEAFGQNYIASQIPNPDYDPSVLAAARKYNALQTQENLDNYNQIYNQAYNNYNQNYFGEMADYLKYKLPKINLDFAYSNTTGGNGNFTYQYKKGGNVKSNKEIINDIAKDNKNKLDKQLEIYYKEYMKLQSRNGKEIFKSKNKK